ncbi:sarcolemmal membrane-associated protein [Tenebrio molitor]|jgi:pSer/pThr/pTyr-binding forkhead associated (FHA) protein|uniref:sarcolemmal membrane-associated protein n=1 Tax=Tenebrio molitor TaxID=7067 RepID=UPI00362498FD
MVVVSGIWVKNVATYPTPAINDMVISNENKMTAKAVLICRPNSHPFQERTLALDQPVKVGRSVARARATATNAIFDCKVLSRHHALLWYENGKFYLQDTKSSNGTFVNNNRLAAETEHHEVSSGDIVQFGVDVIENNRKVTHGCIIATLKLFLPDGKEAKASPSIVENNSHVVPLDELYKLHQIIQEATQREQCLETKLTALQSVVDEARKSAEESWQAYVGEERLLSRVSALETQLQQAGKNWGEDKYREEVTKLQEDSATYQVAAKEALEKLHAERLQALSVATEQERCRISAEQEALLAREQLSQTQQELEEVAQKLTEEQKKANEERIRLEQQQWDLQTRLDAEMEKVEKLQMKLVNSISPKQYPDLFGDVDVSHLDKRIIYNDDLKTKEELLAENDICESEMNKANGVETEQNNHINLTVTPVTADVIDKRDCEEKPESDSDNDDHLNHSLTQQNTIVDDEKENERHVTFSLPEDTSRNGPESPDKDSSEENEKDDFDSDTVDSKTLKYKYQSAQNELKKRIEILESILESNKMKLSELERSLGQEKQANSLQSEENRSLKDELMALQQKWKESCNESRQLRDRVNALVKEVEAKDETIGNTKDQNNVNKSIISSSPVSFEQLVSLEEELVMLKERYAQINDEKSKLQHDLDSLKEQYNKVCNSSYDKMYFYIAPLILMILYLVISAMIS